MEFILFVLFVIFAITFTAYYWTVKALKGVRRLLNRIFK